MANENQKVADKVNKYHKLLENNQKCQIELAKTEEPTLQDFSKCTVVQLTAYIHVREFEATQEIGKDDDWKWPKKGKVEEAETGEDNLIKRAFERKDKPVILREPTKPEAMSPTPNTRHSNATLISITPEKTTFSNE